MSDGKLTPLEHGTLGYRTKLLHYSGSLSVEHRDALSGMLPLSRVYTAVKRNETHENQRPSFVVPGDLQTSPNSNADRAARVPRATGVFQHFKQNTIIASHLHHRTPQAKADPQDDLMRVSRVYFSPLGRF